MLTKQLKLLLLSLVLTQLSMANIMEAEVERLVNQVLKKTQQEKALNKDEVDKIKKLVKLKLKLGQQFVPAQESVEVTRKKSHALNDLLATSPEKSKPTVGKVDTYNKIILKENSQYNFKQANVSTGNDSDFVSSLSSEAEVRQKEMRHVMVKSGDTLSGIAYEVYGSILKYKEIYRANDDILRNPNKIFIGQRLRVPE